MANDFELFQGKTLSSLFQDIYNNQFNKKKHISDVIIQVRDMIKKTSDMAVLGPLLKDLLDTSVRNDDMLLKLATVAQRIYNSQNKGGNDSGILTEEEREQLLKEIDSFNLDNTVFVDKSLDKAKNVIQNKNGNK